MYWTIKGLFGSNLHVFPNVCHHKVSEFLNCRSTRFHHLYAYIADFLIFNSRTYTIITRKNIHITSKQCIHYIKSFTALLLMAACVAKWVSVNEITFVSLVQITFYKVTRVLDIDETRQPPCEDTHLLNEDQVGSSLYEIPLWSAKLELQAHCHWLSTTFCWLVKTLIISMFSHAVCMFTPGPRLNRKTVFPWYRWIPC